MDYKKIVEQTKDTLIKAASSFREDQKHAYERAIRRESNPQAKWVLETIYENALIAEKNKSPLCDDTGIPHLVLDVGRDIQISGRFLDALNEGIACGLRELPGRPMAVKGTDFCRLEQSEGLYEDSGALKPAPIMIRNINADHLKLHILMQGGGPEIRSKTYRVFHQHSVRAVYDEIVDWASNEIGNLGCTPSTLAIGIGRTHFEAASLMLEAMLEGNYEIQNSFEENIVSAVNKNHVGPLGLGGDTTVLAAFSKIGEQRASGVRIVCMRPCCCFEPRTANVLFGGDVL